MSEFQRDPHVPPVYGRATRNWLSLALAVALIAIALAPFVLALGYLIPAGLVETFGRGSHASATRYQEDGSRGGSLEWLERGPIGSLTTPAGRRTSDQVLVLKLMPATVVLLSVTLGLLLWGMSGSTTTNLLAQLGARAAGGDPRERDAALTLDELSRNIGLPAPKLYIVQCSFPTTFSTAKDPRNPLIAVSSGALDLLESPELDTLLAHELSHIADRDSRLDSILDSLAVITEYPFAMFRRKKSSDPDNKVSIRKKLAMLEMVLSPLGLYIFFVSPILNRLISAAVVRGREYNADANAAALTGNPAGLANALAKIGGVATVLGTSALASLPLHNLLTPRIARLMKLYGVVGFYGMEESIAKGKQYAGDHPGMAEDKAGLGGTREHLTCINQGSVMGRVYRLISNDPVPVFDKADPAGMVRARVKP